MSESLQTAAILRSLPGYGSRPRNGKIARLPQHTRELINQMLEDGLPYARILDKLRNSAVPPLPYPISEMNLSNWYRGGFQDWRRQRALDEFLKSGPPLDQPAPRNQPTQNTPQANLQPAATIPDPLAAQLRQLKAGVVQTEQQLRLLKVNTTTASAPIKPSAALNSTYFHSVPLGKGQKNIFPLKPLAAAMTANPNTSLIPHAPCITTIRFARKPLESLNFKTCSKPVNCCCDSKKANCVSIREISVSSSRSELTNLSNTDQVSSMKQLSPKQAAVRTFIANELAAGRPCPSHREIASHFGFASSYAAACHIQALIRKGALIAAAGKARALRLAEDAKPLLRATVAEIPIFGSIPAGFGQDREQETEGCVAVDVATIGFKPTRNTFALRVVGDSMIGRHVCSGDIVILEHGPEPRHGQIVAALIDRKSTLKTFVLKNNKPFLKAENPKYPNLIPSEELMIQGVVRALIRKASE